METIEASLPQGGVVAPMTGTIIEVYLITLFWNVVSKQIIQRILFKMITISFNLTLNNIFLNKLIQFKVQVSIFLIFVKAWLCLLYSCSILALFLLYSIKFSTFWIHDTATLKVCKKFKKMYFFASYNGAITIEFQLKHYVMFQYGHHEFY